MAPIGQVQIIPAPAQNTPLQAMHGIREVFLKEEAVFQRVLRATFEKIGLLQAEILLLNTQIHTEQKINAVDIAAEEKKIAALMKEITGLKESNAKQDQLNATKTKELEVLAANKVLAANNAAQANQDPGMSWDDWCVRFSRQY